MRRAWLLLGLAAAVRAQDAPTSAPEADYGRDVLPILAQHCLSCHGPRQPMGGLNLARFQDEKAAFAKKEVWKEIWRKVDTRQMPPADAESKPTDAEREKLVSWIERTLGSLDGKGAPDPGRVVIRRLNQLEYRNTVRDLVGVEPSVEDFPSDDVGYGFDNIGDVLTLPPLLLEKYVSTAQGVLDRAIVEDVGREPPTRRLEGKDFDGPPETQVKGAQRFLPAGKEIAAKFDVARAGRFLVRVKAGADTVMGAAVKLAVKVDGKEAAELEIKASRTRPAPIEVEIPLKDGVRSVALSWKAVATGGREPRADGKLVVVETVEVIGPVDAPTPKIPESHKRIFVAEPGEKKSPRDAAREVLAAFATRAFRRPASKEQVDRLAKIFESRQKEGETFEAAIRTALLAAMISPSFLFRIEPDRPGDDAKGARPVDEYELASRLSYFLWSSMPDDELFRLAGEGKLTAPATIEAQVRRMLKDPKASAFAESFSSQWLQIRRLEGVSRDKGKFPAFDDDLRLAMHREATMFFEHVMREELSLLTLLDADFTFANEKLARLYGIEGVRGPEMRKVELKDRRRGGVLTMAAVLTCNSNQTRTSPVLRGKWVLETLLGTPPPPPEPDVGEPPEHKDGRKLSMREAMELHRSKPKCMSCHVRMDPIGFGFENYDAIGRWRDADEVGPVDASAALPDGRRFDGPVEFKALMLERKDEFVRTLIEKMLTYALGRGVEFQDASTLRGVHRALEADGYRFSRLVVEIAKSYPFLHRRNKSAGGS
jgi:mono/diheme cytochrome c family protein